MGSDWTNAFKYFVFSSAMALAFVQGFSISFEPKGQCHQSSEKVSVGDRDYTLEEVQSCRRYLEPQTTSYARQRELRGPNQYSWRESRQVRVTSAEQGWVNVFNQDIYPLKMNTSSQTTLVSYLQEVETELKENRLAPESRIHPMEEVAEHALDFVIEAYRLRRSHWPESFLTKLRKVAKDYLDRSVYIVVQDGISLASRRLYRGTIRLIKEKNGVLPLEEYLGIQINAPGKFKVEPGNFAIDKDFSLESWAEMLMHMTSKKLSRFAPDRENQYITYADTYSLSLYSKLGFKPVPASDIILDPGVELVDGKIIKDGVAWTPMQASLDDLETMLEVYVERLRQRGRYDDEVLAIQDRKKEIERQNEVSRFYIGYGTWKGGPEKATLEVKVEREDLSMTYRSGGDLMKFIGKIKLSSLPFKEGYDDWSRDGRVQFRNGVLRVHDEHNSHAFEFEIETNPAFTEVRRVTMKRNGSIESETLF